MLEYMLDTNTCIYVIKNRPAALRERFDQLAETLCISTITLGELMNGVEKSGCRAQNLRAVEEFAARLEVMPFSANAKAGRSLSPGVILFLSISFAGREIMTQIG